MAKIKFVIVPNRKNAQGEYVIFTYISAHYKSVRVLTDVSVKEEHWDKKNGKVIEGKGPKFDNLASFKNTRLGIILSNAKEKMLQFPEKVEAMNVSQLRAYLINDEEPEKESSDFFEYCRRKRNYYHERGMNVSENLIVCVHEKLREYCGREILPFSQVNALFLDSFQHWCLTTPRRPSTNKNKQSKKIQDPANVKFMTQGGVNVYLRYIRTIFNDAIADELPVIYPFKKFKIKNIKTKNRNLPIETIRLIRDYSPANAREEITRDLLMLQIYLCGINVADLWIFDKSVLSEGRIRFYRKKTEKHNRYQSIKVEPEAKKILDKYRGEKHLLWFADTSVRLPGERFKVGELKYKDESTFLKMIDRTIVKIQKALGVHEGIKITDYYIRHTLATLLRTKVLVNGKTKVTMSDVACILGHKEPEHKVTGTYIDEDYEGNDVIIRSFIDLLNEKPQEAKKGKLLTLAEMSGGMFYN